MSGFESLIAKLKAKEKRQVEALNETRAEIAALEKVNAKG